MSPTAQVTEVNTPILNPFNRVTFGMTAQQRAKLDGLPEGKFVALDDYPDEAHPLWDDTCRESFSGNSTPYIATTTPQEIGRGRVLADTFRDCGYIHIQICGEFADSASGQMTMNFEISSENDPDGSFYLDENTRGLWDASPVSHYILTSKPIDCVPGRGSFVLSAVLNAGGHQGLNHIAYLSGNMSWSLMPLSAPGTAQEDVLQTFNRPLLLPFDPTINKQLVVKAYLTSQSGTKLFFVTASRATQFHRKHGFHH